MAFHHHAEDAVAARRQLSADILHHLDLALVLLARVGVACVHHQAAGQFGGFDLCAGRGHAGSVVVGRLAAAQDDMAVLVAACLDDGDLAVLVD